MQTGCLTTLPISETFVKGDCARGRASNSSNGVRAAVPVPREETSDESSTPDLSPAPNASAEAGSSSATRVDLRRAGERELRPSAAARIAAAVGLPSVLVGFLSIFDAKGSSHGSAASNNITMYSYY